MDALGASSDGKAVVQEMKKLPTDDPLFGKGTIRADGRKLHNMYLFEVKKPEESKYPWDYYKVIKSHPAGRGMAATGRRRLRFPQIMKGVVERRPAGGAGHRRRGRYRPCHRIAAGPDLPGRCDRRYRRRRGGETAHLVEAAGCKAMAIRADVSSPGQSAGFVDAVEAGFGPIGIFANNAGIEGVVAPLHEYPEDVFDRLLQVNVKGDLSRDEIRAGEDDPAGKRRDRQYGVDIGDPGPRRTGRLCRHPSTPCSA